MSQNAHTAVLSRGSGAGGAIGLGHSVSNPPGSGSNMNLSSTSSVPWSLVNNGASASGASGNQNVSASATHQQQDAKAAPSPQNSNQSGTTLKEHDLLGLSEVSSSTTRGSPVTQDSLQDEGNDFEELNLKLGPPAVRKNSYPRTQASEQQQQAPAASESGNSHGGLDGSHQATEQGTAFVEKSPSSAEQNAAVNEQQQQQQADRVLSSYVARGGGDMSLSSASQAGIADTASGNQGCRPSIDSEALMKWHAEQVGDRKTSNESLRLGISLHSQRGPAQDGVSEKKTFLSPVDRNRDAPTELKQQQQQEDPCWQQERNFQEDVSNMDNKQERPSVVQEQQQQQVVKQQQQLERQKQQQQQHEAYQMTEKRPLIERKCLPALQQPEQRFQNVPERSPRLQEPNNNNRLWSNQLKYRDCIVTSTASDFQAQHSAQQDLESRAGYSVSAGNFASNRNVYAAPTKLGGVAGAKRNFDSITCSDARSVNDARSGLSGPLPVAGGTMNTSNGPSSEAEAKALCQQQMKVQNGLPMYPWAQKNALPTPSWHIGLEQSGGSFGPFPSQRPGRAPMSKPPSEVGTGAGVDAKAWDGQAKGHQEIVSAASQQQQMMSAPAEAKQQSTSEAAAAPASDVAASSAPRATAAPPAVGWPPIRSFRKNLAVTPRPVPSETPPRQTAPQQPAVSTPSVAGQSNSCMVKVHMDGVPIGRKVDLRTNSSYEKLSQMLDEMFRTFVNGQNGSNRITLASDIKRNFLQGPDYVLTYEDQDGDLMLVGDVPWTMFIDTVKRLRIMKGSEAIGLGTRAAEKANKTTQPNV
ncbi:hypothetical protein Mapa_016616 [Marchantia paleacea]|nr:hypothetical protein Mapa_016616 [Marchantia paleacea]